MLGHALGNSDWKCLAFALMSNHIHIAAVAGQLPMSSWTKAANAPFAWWMNKRHGRIGPVFADRSKDYGTIARNEGRLLAYIHNNPVRAGVVTHARHSDWTSHRAIAGLAVAPPWLHADEALKRAGFDNGKAFDRWVDRTPGESYDVELEEHRRTLRKRGSIELGTPTTDGDVTMIPLLSRRFAHVRLDPRWLVQIVSDVTGVPKVELCSRRRNPPLCTARRIAAKAGQRLGLTPTEIAGALGVSEAAVRKQCRRDLGETPAKLLDAVVDQCQLVMQRLAV